MQLIDPSQRIVPVFSSLMILGMVMKIFLDCMVLGFVVKKTPFTEKQRRALRKEAARSSTASEYEQ